ncbi:carbohydrate ABC transporter permease [Gryllotalpicola protaetiae]|uniref:carbohydrate ABC transporter permease n=1 Tax=Gryllotalpicola protaetiae TaxID=2419771 RepID=UPI001C658EF1|nr:sugar ABC transporter permease [Gryllotalpicola protaetiae]
MPAILLTPAGLVIVALTLVPIGFLVFTSFTDYDKRTLFTGVYNFVGFQQYTAVLSSAAFWEALVRTVLFTAAMVAGSVVIGMGVSQLMLRTGVIVRYLVTIVLIVAWAMPNVATSKVWVWLFQPGYGVIPWLITQLHVFGNVTQKDFTNSFWGALVIIWLLVVWQAVPFIALTLFAAQTQIDQSLIEAARIDGASEWRVYFNITLPFLRPTLGLMTILSIIWDFNVINQIILVAGVQVLKPIATLGVWSYLTAFVNSDVGSGAAIAVITTILLLGITSIYIRNLLKSGEEF